MNDEGLGGGGEGEPVEDLEAPAVAQRKTSVVVLHEL